MKDQLLEAMAEFAHRNNLTPAEAVVLPVLFERAAEKVEMDIDTLLEACIASDVANAYLAKLARDVAVIYAATHG